MSDLFTCKDCGKTFSVPEASLKKYPGWTPRVCLACKNGGKPSGGGRPRGGRQSYSQPSLTTREVLQKYHSGPKNGVFTDGSATPNPGPGGWGVVYVKDDQVVDQRYGHDPDTTNNRMELMALIEAYKMIPEGVELDIHSDSDLAVKTINEWAKSWEKRGWKRKGGAIKNLELVKELYALAQARPEIHLRWIKAHDGSRWNEYADALSTAYLREEI